MQLHGVNLGGWLVLERWITPELFSGLEAQDEKSFCVELGDKKEKILKKHWKTFITDKDLGWIATAGLNAVRIPVGHWIFGDAKPYVGSIEILDWVMEAAAKHNLKVVIDLHGAPGSQNGWDHSGVSGEAAWHKMPENIDRTVEVIAKLADRYKDSSAMAGIELLNEPHPKLPKKVLLNYYQLSYRAARQSLSDDKAVIISDNFQPNAWKKEFTGNNYKNVWLDMHLYQCFDTADKKLDFEGHLAKTTDEHRKLIESVRKKRPVMIGEWSLGLDPKTFEKMDKDEHAKALQGYAQAQIDAFNTADGWFFWTYKTEESGGWNFRYCFESGLISNSYLFL